MRTIGQVLGLKPDIRSFKTDKGNKWLLPNCFVGVEIELENASHNESLLKTMYPHWEFVDEGSLKDRGVEMRFNAPLCGNDLTFAVKKLSKLHPNTKAAIKLSPRTSTHIHIDVRDMNTDQFISFMEYCIPADYLLRSICSETRRLTDFCPPLAGKLTTLSAMKGLKETDAAIKPYIKAQQKYSSVNFAAAINKGSIEFRMFDATLSEEELSSWINLLFSLKLNAMKNPQGPDIGVVRALIREGNLRNAINYFFASPDMFLTDAFDVEEFDKTVLSLKHVRMNYAYREITSQLYETMESNKGPYKKLKRPSPKKKPRGLFDPTEG